MVSRRPDVIYARYSTAKPERRYQQEMRADTSASQAVPGFLHHHVDRGAK